MTPFEIVLLLGCLLPCAAWSGHTAASRALVEDIERARRMCGMSQKQLAAEMGITEQELSGQLAGVKPMNAFRLYGMTNAEFRRELLAQQINRFADVGVLVVNNARLDTLIARLDALLAEAPKPMVKAELPCLSKVQAS